MEKTELMVIPFQVSQEEYSLLIVLQDHNIKRITAYDPADVPIAKMPGSVIDKLKIKSVIIAYCTSQEAQQMIDNAKLGKSIGSTLQMLSRGWEYRPELGDSDDPPVFIMPPGRG